MRKRTVLSSQEFARLKMAWGHKAEIKLEDKSTKFEYQDRTSKGYAKGTSQSVRSKNSKNTWNKKGWSWQVKYRRTNYTCKADYRLSTCVRYYNEWRKTDLNERGLKHENNNNMTTVSSEEFKRIKKAERERHNKIYIDSVDKRRFNGCPKKRRKHGLI